MSLKAVFVGRLHGLAEMKQQAFKLDLMTCRVGELRSIAI